MFETYNGVRGVLGCGNQVDMFSRRQMFRASFCRQDFICAAGRSSFADRTSFSQLACEDSSRHDFLQLWN